MVRCSLQLVRCYRPMCGIGTDGYQAALGEVFVAVPDASWVDGPWRSVSARRPRPPVGPGIIGLILRPYCQTKRKGALAPFFCFDIVFMVGVLHLDCRMTYVSSTNLGILPTNSYICRRIHFFIEMKASSLLLAFVLLPFSWTHAQVTLFSESFSDNSGILETQNVFESGAADRPFWGVSGPTPPNNASGKLVWANAEVTCSWASQTVSVAGYSSLNSECRPCLSPAPSQVPTKCVPTFTRTV